MSYVMCSHILFPATERRGELHVYAVSSVRIESSWKMLTDTAEIILPKKTGTARSKKVTDVFHEGDPVEISLGYNGNLYKEFSGYLTSISTGIPISLKCEDEMYVLKRRTVSVSMQNADLKALLQRIAPGYEVDCYEGVNLGNVRYSNVTAATILEDIRKQTGMYSYFDGRVLRCGKVYGDQVDEPPARVHLERNAVSEELNRRGGEDVKIQVRAVSVLKGGKKLEVTVGDEGGTVKQLCYVGITLEAELKKLANTDYERLKKKGMDGNIVLFGLPRIVHGQRVDIESDLYQEVRGTYYVDKVTKEFSSGANYRQTIELGDEYSG